MSVNELPTDRLSTTDERGNRIYLYPADVRGKFRNTRNWVSFVLMVIFLILPWIKINGVQSVLLSLPERKFSIFGQTFFAHDAPILVFIFGAMALGLFLVTAVWGRVWCGWACPQTVFIDSVFRKIERWVEGDAFVRRKLDSTPWGPDKFKKKGLKWFLFVVASLVISHSFLAYFVGTETLADMIQHSPIDNPTSFIIMSLTTLFVLFDFGWFREQFCTVLCPYARFQSVLMDHKSMVVGYDLKRGEPRRGKTQTDVPQGDCVNCYRCVQVCPTGIDIRRGVQLECIACTACVDACDEVMTKVKKPVGLIRYSTADLVEGKQSTKAFYFLRPRVLAYTAILLFFVVGLLVKLNQRSPLDAQIIRAVDQPYTVMGNATDARALVLNHFKLDLINQNDHDIATEVFLPVEVKNLGVELVISNMPNSIAPGKKSRSDLFLKFPKNILVNGKALLNVGVRIKGQVPEFSEEKEVKVVGPFN